MKRNRVVAILVFCVALFVMAGCAQKMTSTLTSSNYDKKTNATSYTVLPYGSATLPGAWTKVRYVASARQQFFRNNDSVTVSLAFGPADKFEFSKEELTGFPFVKEYYEWESLYMEKSLGQKVSLVVTDSINKYLIARVYSDKVNEYQLFGARDCGCKSGAFQHYTITGGKLSNDEKVKFLQDIYLAKNK